MSLASLGQIAETVTQHKLWSWTRIISYPITDCFVGLWLTWCDCKLCSCWSHITCTWRTCKCDAEKWRCVFNAQPSEFALELGNGRWLGSKTRRMMLPGQERSLTIEPFLIQYTSVTVTDTKTTFKMFRFYLRLLKIMSAVSKALSYNWILFVGSSSYKQWLKLWLTSLNNLISNSRTSSITAVLDSSIANAWPSDENTCSIDNTFVKEIVDGRRQYVRITARNMTDRSMVSDAWMAGLME